MNPTAYPDTSALEAAQLVFRRYGLQAASNQALATALQLSPEAFAERYADRAVLVHDVIIADIERQKRDHSRIYAQYHSAVERLYSLLQYALQDLADVSPAFFVDIQQAYPQTWEVVTEHLATYSTPQLHQLLNDGIRSQLFRSDINIQLVTKILMEQINMTLNPLVFPPDRYNMAEVFRSVFLYYVRGICTEEGARIAANHFSRL